MNKFILSNPFSPFYANDNDALVPELWANESLMILEENMVIGNLIHRDFSPLVANFGDVVNTRKPQEFKAKRKTDADNVTVQDAKSTNIPVKLDQHIHTSFMIKDGEESKSFKELVQYYLQPAMLAQARFIDQILLGQYVRFLSNSIGTLGTAITSDSLVDLGVAQDILKVPQANRNLILGPRSYGALLKIDKFVEYQDTNESPPALKTAYLGERFGYNLYKAQNMASIPSGNTVITTFRVNLTAGYPKGYAGAIVVGTGTGIIQNGTWVTFAGDSTPYYVIAHTETSSNTTGITLSTPLRNGIANTAVVTFYTPGQVQSGPYAAGYAKEITVNGFSSNVVTVGSPIVFGSDLLNVYTAVDVTLTSGATTGITLDRPIVTALATNDYVGIGPAGEYNFAPHRNSIAFVSRPLAAPKSGTGALAAVQTYNGYGMRAVITYDGNAQGHLVTLDCLAGVAQLDPLLGAVLFGG